MVEMGINTWKLRRMFTVALFMSNDGWYTPHAHQQVVEYACRGTLSSQTKEYDADSCCNVREPLKYAKGEKPETQVNYCMVPRVWNIQNS